MSGTCWPCASVWMYQAKLCFVCLSCRETGRQEHLYKLSTIQFKSKGYGPMESWNLPFQNSKSTRTAGRVGCQHSLRHPLERSSDQTPAGAKQQDEGYCISAASKDFWILQIRRRLVHYISLLGVWTPGQRKIAISPGFHSYITTFFTWCPQGPRQHHAAARVWATAWRLSAPQSSSLSDHSLWRTPCGDEGRQIRVSEVNLWWNGCLEEQIAAGLQLELWTPIPSMKKTQ